MKKKIIWAMALVSLLPFTNNLQAQKTAENNVLDQSKKGLSNYNSNVQNQKVMETKKTFVDTKIGQIAVYSKTSDSGKIPVIFLHGVYFDHNLWNTQAAEINDRTVIMVDMPLHGESKQNVPEKWTLEDCADMLIDILDKLQIPKVIAIGHSWGSMTILRAANKHPEKFASVGFCNMPFEKATAKMIKTFKTQHAFLIFRNFYMKQTGNYLFGKDIVKKDPTLLSSLLTPMKKLSNKEIKLTDKYVILDADDAAQMIKNLKAPSLALKGKDDYVPVPLTIQTIIVPGGHVSPLASPKEVADFCKKVIEVTQ